jgi:fatty-acyl-CoA synthase
MNLAGIGRFWAKWKPDHIAIRFAERDTTWAALDANTNALAAGLRARGIAHGDRLALLSGNCLEWCELTMAAWKLGAVIVPVNTRFTATEVAYVAHDSGARLLFVEPALAGAASQVPDSCEVLPIDDLSALRRADLAAPWTDTGDHDPAFICYTSGTTGDPKGAVLTHRSFDVSAQAWGQALGLGDSDRVVLPFPLAFTGGLALFLFTYWSGSTLLLEPMVDTDRLFDLFEQQRATALLSVPVIIQQMVDHPRWATADLSSWRIACSGGAPVPLELLKSVQARGIPMSQTFSLTEASAAATVLPDADALNKLGSAGIPMLHTRIRIVDEDDNDLPSGEVGEILVSGPQVMSGYWNQGEATAAALRGGWLHTGDLGYLDADGYLYVVDRVKDMLISGGLNVYPAEIERLLAGFPGVIEIAVVGVPDAKWGETPAVVVFTAGADFDTAAMAARCQEVLADFKRPRYVSLSDQPLPRGMSGKILKRQLKAALIEDPSRLTPLR